MRFRLASLGVFAIVVGLVAAPIPKAKPPKDEDAIQGVWQVEKFDSDGAPVPSPAEAAQMKVTFKEGKITMTHGGMAVIEGTFKLDPTAKVKEIDLTQNNRVTLGIYELDGDTLKLCLAEKQGAARPTEMKPEGKQVVVATLKRVKDAKKDK